MIPARTAVPIAKTVHLLSVCAWIGGGLGILLLLILDLGATTAAELQAFNRVITAIDDCIIAPGAFTTLASGLALARASHLPLLRPGFLRFKLYCTGLAIGFGLFCVAPRLERLLTYARTDDLAVFDDRLYAQSYLLGAVGCGLQALLVLGLLAISILRPRMASRRRTATCPTTPGVA